MSEKQEWCSRLKRVLDEPILTDSGRQAIVMDITNLRKDIKLFIEKRDAIIKYALDEKCGLRVICEIARVPLCDIKVAVPPSWC